MAESFGDLDPRIDARENDVPPSEFGGFHRIEKALWEEGTAKGMAPVAEQLLADVEELRAEGEERSNCRRCRSPTAPTSCSARSRPRRSPARRSATRTSTWSTSRPTSKAPRRPSKRSSRCSRKKDPKLAKEIEASFEDVYASLKPYRRGDGFVSYTELTKADTRKLAQEIDALAEELSQVPAQIVG